MELRTTSGEVIDAASDVFGPNGEDAFLDHVFTADEINANEGTFYIYVISDAPSSVYEYRLQLTTE